MKEQQKEESSCQAQVYSEVFYFLLEYRLPYYKEGCNMVIFIKPKFSKPVIPIFYAKTKYSSYA
jgi:hypothetical protein